jgi:hypothetical protein
MKPQRRSRYNPRPTLFSGDEGKLLLSAFRQQAHGSTFGEVLCYFFEGWLGDRLGRFKGRDYNPERTLYLLHVQGLL